MRFESPSWLALLILIPLLAFIFASGERRSARDLQRFAAARLLPVLGRSAKWPRVLRLALIMVTIALLAVAMARPSYGYHLREIHGKGADVIFAVDVSRSMLCTDISPDRLTRAKLAAKDLLEVARGHRIGVIPFSKEAFLQCPLTLDETAVSLSLDALGITSIPKQGTSIAGPIAEARKAFSSSGDNKRILVIFTDGEDLEGEGLREARETKDMIIVTVGTGTPQGAPVPISTEAGSGYIKDDSGNFVTSRLDSSNLESVASATGGFYVSVSSPTLSSQFKDAISKDEKESSAEAANIRLPIIRYRWPLAAALVLLIAESFIPAFRRKGGAVLALLVLLLPTTPNNSSAAETPAPALEQVAPVKTDKKPAVPMGNPREAYNKGVELYNKRDYAKATTAFEKAMKDSALSPDELKKQIYGNAGAAKLAEALSMIPDGEEPMDPKADTAARELLNKAKGDLEKALSLAPDDKILQHNFKLVNDALDDLKNHKPKPQDNKPKQKTPKADDPKKKDDPLPTPKHKEEPPPPNKDCKNNNDDKGNQGDQGGGGKDKDSKSSKGDGQNDKNNKQQNGQSGSSGGSGGSSQSQQGGGQQQQQQQQQPQNQPQQKKDEEKDKSDKKDQPQPQPQQGQQQQQQNQGNGQQNQQQQPQGQQPNNAGDQGQKEQQSGQQNQPQKDKPEQKAPQKDNSKDKKGDGDKQQQQPQNGPEKQQQQGQQNEQDKQPQAGNGADKQQPQPSAGKKDSGANADEQQGANKPQPKPQNAAGDRQPEEKNAQQQGKDKQKKDSGAGESGEKKQAEARPKPQPQPAQAGAGDDGRKEAPKQGAKEKSGEQPEQAQGAAEKKSASAQAMASGDQSPESKNAKGAAASTEEPRREGDHTASLARTGEKSGDKQQVVQQSGAAAGPDNGGIPVDGKMTSAQAERLLKILQDDEQLLPSGQLKNQRQNNTSGRDW